MNVRILAMSVDVTQANITRFISDFNTKQPRAVSHCIPAANIQCTELAIVADTEHKT